MPNNFQERFSRKKEKKLTPDSTASLWTIASEFLKSESLRIEQDTPWLLDTSKEEPRHQQFGSSGQHVNIVRARNFEERQSRVGPCVQCSMHHTFIQRGGNLECVSCRLSSCDSFKDLSPQERASVVESNKACASCLDWTHERTEC